VKLNLERFEFRGNRFLMISIDILSITNYSVVCCLLELLQISKKRKDVGYSYTINKEIGTISII
jgi:hypothetical protein